MRKICRTILAAGLMACMMIPAVNVMAADDIVGNWQADEAGVGFAKISASLVGLDGLCININEDNTADIIFAVDGDGTKTVNEEREIQDQQKIDRGPNVQVLTTHAGLNPSSKSGYERETRVIKNIKIEEKEGEKYFDVNPPRLIRFREYRRGFQTPHELSFMPATLGRNGFLTTDTAQTQWLCRAASPSAGASDFAFDAQSTA